MRVAVITSLMLTSFLLSACTFVDLSVEGEKVRVLDADEVSKCKLLGRTNANTKAKVAGVPRHENAINHELIALARNAAAELGGDTIVAEGPAVEGKRAFQIYRCVPR